MNAGWTESENYYEFKGAIKAFRQWNANIVHTRIVRKYKGAIEMGSNRRSRSHTSLDIHQLWHPAPAQNLSIRFEAFDKNNKQSLEMKKARGWHSSGIWDERRSGTNYFFYKG